MARAGGDGRKVTGDWSENSAQVTLRNIDTGSWGILKGMLIRVSYLQDTEGYGLCG